MASTPALSRLLGTTVNVGGTDLVVVDRGSRASSVLAQCPDGSFVELRMATKDGDSFWVLAATADQLAFRREILRLAETGVVIDRHGQGLHRQTCPAAVGRTVEPWMLVSGQVQFPDQPCECLLGLARSAA